MKKIGEKVLVCDDDLKDVILCKRLNEMEFGTLEEFTFDEDFPESNSAVVILDDRYGTKCYCDDVDCVYTQDEAEAVIKNLIADEKAYKKELEEIDASGNSSQSMHQYKIDGSNHRLNLLSDALKQIEQGFEKMGRDPLRSEALMSLDNQIFAPQQEKSCGEADNSKKVLECSVRGDRRFSALFAKVSIKGKERSIEEWYQNAKRTADGKKVGKGNPFDHIIDPFTGDKFPASEAPWLYRGLWINYFTNNPDLVEYASQFDDFSNAFSGKGLENSPEEIIGAYVKGDRQHYVDFVKCSRWYKNMASKEKPSLACQIQTADEKASRQLSFYDVKSNNIAR